MTRPRQLVPPLQLVTGKGGVGKSTYAAALALAAARTGREVLAVELNRGGGLSSLLGVTPTAHGVPVPAGPGLHVAWYDGEASLAEFIVRFMPFGSRFKPFFSHPLYRAFVTAGPGVRELMAIGKVRDEVLGLSAGRPQWDLLVVDAGASGHALQLLGMPAATARTFSSGLAHREATKVAGFLADPRQTEVHVVALPEVMPLEEAAEIIEALREKHGLPVGHLVVNRCRPVAPEGVDEALAQLEAAAPGDGPGAAPRRALAAVARRALGWERLQEAGIAALERRVAKPALRLPRLIAERFGRAEVEQLAAGLVVEEEP
jgi:anion-transporting  ArsA/GET3 family ATPase